MSKIEVMCIRDIVCCTKNERYLCRIMDEFSSTSLYTIYNVDNSIIATLVERVYKESFINLNEWRNKQLNKILDD